jgi:hypothetical protein
MKPVHGQSGPLAALLASALVLACAQEKEHGGEVTDTSAAQGEICEGDAIIVKTADLARYATCTEITGRLQLKRSEVASLELPRLRTIGGRITVRKNGRLEALSLPALEEVGKGEGDDIVIEQNAVLQRVDLGKVVRAGAGAAIRENPALTDLEMGGLVEVEGAGIDVSGNAALVNLLLPQLRSADYLNVARCAKLVTIDAPHLEWVLQVAVEDNPSLRELSMPLLVKIYADPEKNAVRYGLVISRNAGLETLKGFARLEGLGRKGPLRVTDNPRLSTCEVKGLASRMTEKGWKGEASICGNKADECGRDECPAGE